MRFIADSSSVTPDIQVGGKARALAALAEESVPIPPWFVVTPAAFYESLLPEQARALEQADSPESIAAVVSAVRPSAHVMEELQAPLSRLLELGATVAVRSSASDEDGPQHSFAGQLDSYLFVEPEKIADKIAAVWQSGFSPRILAYRREHDLDLLPRVPAVLVQAMVDADAAGVAFSADPVSHRRGVVVVGAVPGLGSALVSGECDADTYQVDRESQIIDRTIAAKQHWHRADSTQPEGVRSDALPAERRTVSTLSDEQLREVAAVARAAQTHFGRPQDIEWAIRSGTVYLLQSRPITSLAGTVDPDGQLQLWDNSNIAESYNGITTPLTFSFARRAYEGVYREFCRILRVPARTLEANAHLFPHTLGLVRGRVYYNLLTWYQMLALLPGFKLNRRFMEQMMGVSDALADELVADIDQSRFTERVRDAVRLMVSAGALIRHHLTLEGTIRSFYSRLNEALDDRSVKLEQMRPDELVAYYGELERKLLTRWDAPLINDFLAMIFYGLLRKLAGRWCADENGGLHNDLLCGEGGIISTEPAHRVRHMAELAANSEPLTTTLCDADMPTAVRAIQSHAELAAGYREYLDKFGDRCLEELKLESLTLHDDPTPLVRSIGSFARRIREGHAPAAEDQEARRRTEAEQRAAKHLRGHPFRRAIFRWVVKNARRRVRDRENLRFERTRVFGRVRRIFVELGKRLAAEGVLGQPRDIFYLDHQQVMGFVDGTASCTDLRGLVAVQKREFQRYREAASPADRFSTRGAVHLGNPFTAEQAEPDLPAGERQGIGCCPGIVRGTVRVISDPRGATLRSGEILVALRTDPGWITLFPAAAGLLVEHGSILSHSAIVAREMGIPAIVSVPGVTRWLKDGDQVEFDGSQGRIRKLDATQHEVADVH